MKGPHGLHNVNDTKWIAAHGVFYMRDEKRACQPCHGTDLKGTGLSAAATDRICYAGVRGRIRIRRAQQVSCTLCHKQP